MMSNPEPEPFHFTSNEKTEEFVRKMRDDVVFVDWRNNIVKVKPSEGRAISSNPKASASAPHVFVTRAGIYEVPGTHVENGKKHDSWIYLVRPTRPDEDKQTHLYACVMVRAPTARLTKTGKVVSFEYQYEKGAMLKLKPEQQMTEARAKELQLEFCNCMCCGRPLKQAHCVKHRMGDQCYKEHRDYFREE